jgi:hypothetical protein
MERVQKQPYEEFPISVNFNRNFTDGEAIVSQTVTAYDKDGVDASAQVTHQSTITNDEAGNVIVTVLGGEEAKSPYKISVRCVTTTGNKWEHDVQLRVRDL